MRNVMLLGALIGITSWLPGCSILFPPPPLNLTHEELVEAERVGNSNPAKAALGRSRWLAMHPEWPDPIREAITDGVLTSEMSRKQALAAWGMPSYRHGGFIVPLGYEVWTYRRTSPDIEITWGGPEGRERASEPVHEADSYAQPPRRGGGWLLQSQ
jgi:hypothetical protein